MIFSPVCTTALLQLKQIMLQFGMLPAIVVCFYAQCVLIYNNLHLLPTIKSCVEG